MKVASKINHPRLSAFICGANRFQFLFAFICGFFKNDSSF